MRPRAATEVMTTPTPDPDRVPRRSEHAVPLLRPRHLLAGEGPSCGFGYVLWKPISSHIKCLRYRSASSPGTDRYAIAAGARLMADKAHWLAPDVRLSVAIVSALERPTVDEGKHPAAGALGQPRRRVLARRRSIPRFVAAAGLFRVSIS